MSLANGLSYLAIPGPSVMPERVLRAMHRASPNIYKGELHELTASLIPDLKAVARTNGEAVVYIGNGHSAWVAALANVTSRGDTVLVAATGEFGIGWGEIATGLGLNVETVDFGRQSAVDPQQVEDALRKDTTGRIKAVLVCHVDTSTSAKSDMFALREAIDAADHDALLMADCIASLGCDRFEMDQWGVDVTVAACQKGLMTPAGLSFVFYNDKANSKRGDNVTSYWDWRSRVDPEVYFRYFNGTAPTHHLYGLREALDMIKDEGIEHVWTRHKALAETIWAAFDAWSSVGPMALNIADPLARSHAVTSVVAGHGHGLALQNWCETRAGLTLGIGLGREPSHAYFRLGHMGHVNAHMIMGVLGTIEAGMKALKIPHGEGALAAAAKTIALNAPAPKDAYAGIEAEGEESRESEASKCC